MVFHLLVKPVLSYFLDPFSKLEVVLKESISSDPGVEEYLPVLIEQKNGAFFAWPVRAKPSLFYPFIFSQGAVKIPIGLEIIKKGQVVEAILWKDL
jgi:molybdopterin biosynthesis enzyme